MPYLRNWQPTDEDRDWVKTERAKGSPVEWMIYKVPSRNGSVMTEGAFRRAFRAELRWGREERLSAVKGKLFKLAMQGDLEAIKFILRTQDADHWSEKRTLELTGKDGQPIQHQHTGAVLIVPATINEAAAWEAQVRLQQEEAQKQATAFLAQISKADAGA